MGYPLFANSHQGYNFLITTTPRPWGNSNLVFIGECGMDLERRSKTRKAVKQEVMIGHELGHRLCKIHDLSLKGAMLELGWGALTRGVEIELTISLPSTKGRMSYRLPARVARITQEGTAIKFRELDSSTHEAMQRYLQEGRRPA